MTQMTRDEARHLSRYLASIRERMGPSHRWDAHGIEAILADARDKAPSPDLAVAAIKAARNPANRTPAIIGMDGPHWSGSEATPRPDAIPTGHRCRVCDQPRERHTARDHEFEQRADLKRAPDAMRAIVEEAKGRIEPPRTAEPVDRQPAQSHPAAAALRDALRAAKGAS